MDSKERSSVERLEKTVNDLSQQVRNFQSQVTTLVTALQAKVDQKHVPINLEQDILSVLQQTMQESIKKSLGDYNSPLPKYITTVLSQYENDIKSILSDAFSKALSTEEFKNSVNEGIAHKVSRALIAVGDAGLDKVTNDLKQNPEFKAKATLLIADLVKEFTKR